MVSLIERDHANVSFCSNHILGTALPPPSVGGLRQRGPVTWPFALPRPAPSRRPRAVLHGSEVARRRARAQARTPPGRRIFSSCPCSPPPRRYARFLQPRVELAVRHPARASFAVIHGAHPGAPVPSAPPSERLSGLPSSPSVPRHEVPGFGAVCSLVRLAMWTIAPERRRSPLACPSRPPVASLPSPSEPARGEPVDRRDFCCCRADREGSESPFTPHGVPPRAWSMARPLPPKGEKSWSP